MSILFDTRTLALGDDTITEIDFDFLITKKADILFTIVENGEDNIEFDGDDTTYLSNLTFDPISGGGTVTLLAALATGKTLYIDLNVVEPDQPNLFRDRSTFSLRLLENALDYIVTQIQTLFRQSERSLKFGRDVDLTSIDMRLPAPASGLGRIPLFKTTGNGWEWGPTADDIANAQQYATDAEAAKVAAEAAQAATEALQPLVIGSSSVPYDIVAGTGLVIPATSSKKIVAYIQGSGGAVDISAVPQITYPTSDGQELEIICCSDTNTVKFDDGNGLKLNGNYLMVNNSVLSLISKGNLWVEKTRNHI